MKSKNILKIVIGICIAVVLVFGLTQTVKAYDWSGTIKNIDNTQTQGNTENTITTVMGSVIYIVRIIAMGIAVIMLIVLGVRYITASAGMRAEFKKELPMYVTGAVLIFAASFLLRILQDFIENNFNDNV